MNSSDPCNRRIVRFLLRCKLAGHVTPTDVNTKQFKRTGGQSTCKDLFVCFFKKKEEEKNELVKTAANMRRSAFGIQQCVICAWFLPWLRRLQTSAAVCGWKVMDSSVHSEMNQKMKNRATPRRAPLLSVARAVTYEIAARGTPHSQCAIFPAGWHFSAGNLSTGSFAAFRNRIKCNIKFQWNSHQISWWFT